MQVYAGVCLYGIIMCVFILDRNKMINDAKSKMQGFF